MKTVQRSRLLHAMVLFLALKAGAIACCCCKDEAQLNRKDCWWRRTAEDGLW